MIIIRLAALLGQTLAELRAMAGMSQQQVGERAGVADSRISKYERTLVTPDIETTRKLFNAAGYHLAAVPIVEAETAAERAAVIAAGRAVADLGGFEGRSDALFEALTELELAEQRAKEGSARAADAKTPQEIIAELRAELRRWETFGAAVAAAVKVKP